MTITRRTLLKQLAVVAAGVALVPSLSRCTSKPSVLYKKVAITQDQEQMLAAMADTIIPKTSTPGALDVKTPEFAAKMIDDCYSSDDQQKWLRGLKAFEELSEKQNGKAFEDLDATARLDFLKKAFDSKEENDLTFFLKSTKNLTVRGYTSSEYFMTEVTHYNMIPGKFKGCVPLNNPS